MYNKRFQSPIQGKQFDNEYDIDTDEIADIQNRGVSPVKIFSITDRDHTGTLFLNEPGYGFVMYFKKYSGAVSPEGFCNIYVNQGDATDPLANFPAKHNRGFIGAFSRLFLSWPTGGGDGDTAVLVIFKSKNMPWIGGNEAT